jgi:hypothetical protein
MLGAGMVGASVARAREEVVRGAVVMIEATFAAFLGRVNEGAWLGFIGAGGIRVVDERNALAPKLSAADSTRWDIAAIGLDTPGPCTACEATQHKCHPPHQMEGRL